MQDRVLVTEMQDNFLEFVDTHGVAAKMPIVGAFVIKQKYYIVLYAEEAQELLALRIYNDGEQDHVQAITDKEEWDQVTKAWKQICDKVVNEQFTSLDKLRPGF